MPHVLYALFSTRTLSLWSVVESGKSHLPVFSRGRLVSGNLGTPQLGGRIVVRRDFLDFFVLQVGRHDQTQHPTPPK